MTGVEYTGLGIKSVGLAVGLHVDVGLSGILNPDDLRALLARLLLRALSLLKQKVKKMFFKNEQTKFSSVSIILLRIGSMSDGTQSITSLQVSVLSLNYVCASWDVQGASAPCRCSCGEICLHSSDWAVL